MKLASMVVSRSQNPDTFDPIFLNYFRPSDRDAVISEQESCIYFPLESTH